MRVMTLWKLYRRVMALYTIVVALAALSGIGPGAIPAVPGAPPTAAPAPAYTAPAPAVPAPPARKVIGSCSTSSDGRLWVAGCVVDGQQTPVPGTFASHAAAVAAIQAYRAANG